MRISLPYFFLKLGIWPALFCLPAPSLVSAQSPPQPLPETRALLDRGAAAVQQSKMEEAAHTYEQAVQTAREHKDRPGEAAALTELGRTILFQQPEQAMLYFTQALPIYQEIGDKFGRALCLLNLGNGANITSKPQKALEYYEAARRAYLEQGIKSGQAAALNGMGAIYRMTGQPRKALDYFLPALAIYQAAGDKARSLQVLINIGAAYGEMADTAQAQENLEKALALARELGRRPEEGLLLSNLATVQGRMGNAHQALAYYEQALPLLEESGNKDAAATCLSNMAQTVSQEGNLLSFLQYKTRALTMHQDVGNRSGMARDLDDLGSFYTDIGQLEEGLKYYQEAVRMNRDTGDVFGEMTVLNNLGRLYDKLHQPEQAQACYERSLRLTEKAENKDSKAYTLYYLSGSWMQTGKSQEALAACEEARNLFRTVSDVPGEASAELQLGQFYDLLGQIPPARAHYEHALELYRSIDDVSGEAETSAALGALDEKQNRTSAAEQRYTRALALLENTRAGLGGLTEAKVSYLEQQLPVYHRYIGLLLRTGQEAKAFAWTQKAKARVLIDLMESGKVDAAQAMTPADRQQEARLKQRDKALSQQWLAAVGELDDLKRQAQPDKSRTEQAEKQARAIRRQQQQFEQDWRAFRQQLFLRNPRLAEQRSARIVTLEEAAAALPEDTALLEYILLNPGQARKEKADLALFVVTQQGGKSRLRVYRLKTGADALVQTTQELYAACAGRPDTAAERPFTGPAHQLYRLLIAPAEAALAGKKRLIVCPDGPLWDVPFQALLTSSAASDANRPQSRSRSVFLWERYTLDYAYSATGMKAALDARRRPNRPPAQQTLLVLADPDFGQSGRIAYAGRPQVARGLQDAPARGLYARGGGMGALPATRIEAGAILAAFPDAVLKTGSAAQEGLVKQAGGNYRYLHFATHAIFNDAAPMLSGVVLARPPKDSPEDGILTVRELFDLNLGTDMIVLSACETARGAKMRGEGLIGLTWAAFVAGARTQVVSQWSVDDAATARLMGGFYEGLKQGKTKDAALRSAALTLLHDGKHAHPFYWAPFLVMGDWR